MIAAKNLTKSFDDIKALDNISFEMEDGSVYGLVGSNGAGKSTLLRLISGVYYADGGSITIDGIECFDNPEIKSQNAFLGDTPYFLRQSNLKEMKAFYKGMYPSFDDSEYKRLLDIFPLDEKKRISTFSKGMQRQASLILLLATKPRYLLLDEAFDGLDVVMRRVLTNLIMESVEQRGMTAIISSHNLRELEDVCDHIALIHNGNLIFNDNLDTLKNSVHKIQAVFNGVPELEAFEQLNIIKAERTGSVLHIIARGEKEEILKYINTFSPLLAESIEPTLEEIFIFELEATGYDVKNILE